MPSLFVLRQVYNVVREEITNVFVFCFLQGLNGFIMMTTQTGKLLYISDNAAEYLGHSMVSVITLGITFILGFIL